MKKFIIPILIALFLCSCAEDKKPVVLRQGKFYTEEQGKAELEKMKTLYSNKVDWEVRKQLLRKSMLEGLNLSPLPERTPLNASISSKRVKDGYTVENVSFECIPGFYVCGNLYRPVDNTKKYPAILCPHGHFTGDSLGMYGRFRPDMQYRCAMFARMGAVVFSYNMFGYGESGKQLNPSAVIELPVRDSISKYHGIPLALTMQTWSSMRGVDFLQSLPDVDPSRIAITGASGGGTQSFLLSALDDRVSVSIPVVMVACQFFGGCNCESGLPIHESADHFTNNTEIAAMIAPKPMLLVSDGDDWTKNVPEVEFPFIQRTYSFYDAAANVEYAHFAQEKHDYGVNKRVPVYHFLAKHLGMNINAITDANGAIDESKVDIEAPETLLAFSRSNPFPANALKGSGAIEQAIKKLQ